MSKFVPLFDFTVSVSRQVDEVTTRVEDGKTTTETVKATKTVQVPVCLKKPSRIERDEADLERAVWETHFMNKGIMPKALLLKTYANNGGILSEDEFLRWKKMQADFLQVQSDLKRLQSTDPTNKAAIDAAALSFVTLRDDLIAFEQEYSTFFSNTAEAKAREKLIQWLVMHLSHYRPVKADESFDEWTPLFIGKTLDEKLDYFDEKIDENDDIITKARAMLWFFGTVLTSSDGPITKEDKEEIEAFAQTVR